MSRLALKTMQSGEETSLRPYLCYVHRPARSIADLTLIVCEKRDLERKVEALTAEWPSFTCIEVYDGEHRVLARHGAGEDVAA